MSRRAFTLVELLVVIAIIGLLSTVAAMGFQSTRIKARNMKRNSDIEQLSKAFYLAYQDAGSYPTFGWRCISSVCGGSWGGVGNSDTLNSFIIPTYVAAKPTDPLGGTRTLSGYLYANPWGGTSVYDGYVYPSGAYLDWALETTPGVSCGHGHIYSSGANYTECLLLLEP